MRIRVSTVPPLSPARVWSSLSSLPSAATVNDLKHSLCTQIPALKGLRSDQIQLFVDDFELLDTLPTDVVRENDHVHVKRVNYRVPASVLRKRKRSDSTTSSSSSSSSSSPSSSCSSSSSSSSSDSSSGFYASPSKLKAVGPRTERLPNQRIHVPPGMGKPATHSRNVRRRRKLQHERNVIAQDSDDPTVGVNAIPLGSHVKAEVPVTLQTVVDGHGEFSDLTMASLSNKNKRRGFKNAMGKDVPPKITFSEQLDPNLKMNGRDQAPTPRLVPPSEKQEKGLLPPNVFVTSVNVEEGLRPSKKSKSVVPNTKRSEGSSSMGYTAGGSDHTAIQARWDSLGLVTGASGLPIGTMVGWKALGINPVTITPEVMLRVGTVVDCDENQVTVKTSDWTGVRLKTEEDAEEVEESHEWGEVVGQWRIVSV